MPYVITISDRPVSAVATTRVDPQVAADLEDLWKVVVKQGPTEFHVNADTPQERTSFANQARTWAASHEPRVWYQGSRVRDLEPGELYFTLEAYTAYHADLEATRKANRKPRTPKVK